MMQCNNSHDALCYNLYPWNSKPTSIFSSVCLVTLVALSILGVIAQKYYPAAQFPTLNAVGVSLFLGLLLTPFAIMMCKKRSFEERYPLPFATLQHDNLPSPIVNGLPLNPAATQERVKLVFYQFDWLIQTNHVDDFTKAIEEYDSDTFYELFFSPPDHHSLCLFDRILRNRQQVLVKACLEKIGEHRFSTLQLENLLTTAGNNKPLITLILVKATPSTELNLVNLARQQGKNLWKDVQNELRGPLFY